MSFMGARVGAQPATWAASPGASSAWSPGPRRPTPASRPLAPAAAEQGRRFGDIMGSRWGDAEGSANKHSSSDSVDEKQQVDIERLINVVHELQDQVRTLDAALIQAEDRNRERLAGLRSAIGSRGPAAAPLPEEAATGLGSADEGDAWESYRNSFTLLMAKGYLLTVDQLRDRLMVYTWELGLRPTAVQLGVSRFEAFCAANSASLSFETLSALYDDPGALHLIENPHLRMQARSLISAAEAEGRAACFATCTTEAQRLAAQFSEGEFISKLIPDPLEHGVVDALRKVIIPAQRLMGGGK